MYYSKLVIKDKINSVESKTTPVLSPDFIEATESEYTDYISSLPQSATEIVRDLPAELDKLKADLIAKGVL